MQVNLPVVNYDQMGVKVRDYRASMNAAYKDDVAQLKAARAELKEARKTGDKEAIAAAQQAIADVQQLMRDNRAQLQTVHDNVAQVREARQQLAADVKAKNVDAIQQDIAAFNEHRDQVFADLMA
jgi:uncharacterized protein (DUF3084 family)